MESFLSTNITTKVSDIVSIFLNKIEDLSGISETAVRELWTSSTPKYVVRSKRNGKGKKKSKSMIKFRPFRSTVNNIYIISIDDIPFLINRTNKKIIGKLEDKKCVQLSSLEVKKLSPHNLTYEEECVAGDIEYYVFSETKIDEVNSIPLEKVYNDNTSNETKPTVDGCISVLKSGVRKGECCGAKVTRNTEYCSRHKGK